MTATSIITENLITPNTHSENRPAELAIPVAVPNTSPFGLTPREAEVMPLMADGMTNIEISAKLGISVKTVEAHRARIFKKLGAKNVGARHRHRVPQRFAEVARTRWGARERGASS